MKKISMILFVVTVQCFTQSLEAQRILWEHRPVLPTGFPKAQKDVGTQSLKHYLNASGNLLFELDAYNEDYSNTKKLIVWVSTKGSLVGNIIMEDNEYPLGIARMSASSVSIYTSVNDGTNETLYLNTYTASNKAVTKVKSFEIGSGGSVFGDQLALFPPASSNSGGAIVWGEDETGFYIRRFAPL